MKLIKGRKKEKINKHIMEYKEIINVIFLPQNKTCMRSKGFRGGRGFYYYTMIL